MRVPIALLALLAVVAAFQVSAFAPELKEPIHLYSHSGRRSVDRGQAVALYAIFCGILGLAVPLFVRSSWRRRLARVATGGEASGELLRRVDVLALWIACSGVLLIMLQAQLVIAANIAGSDAVPHGPTRAFWCGYLAFMSVAWFVTVGAPQAATRGLKGFQAVMLVLLLGLFAFTTLDGFASDRKRERRQAAVARAIEAKRAEAAQAKAASEATAAAAEAAGAAFAHAATLRDSDPPAAEAAYRKLLDDPPDDGRKKEALVGLARVINAQGRPDEALDILYQGSSFNENDAAAIEAHWLRYDIHVARGDFGSAMDELRAIVDRGERESKSEAVYRMSELLRKQGKLEEALRALELAEGRVIEKARLLVELGRPQEAKVILERLSFHPPGSVPDETLKEARKILSEIESATPPEPEQGMSFAP